MFYRQQISHISVPIRKPMFWLILFFAFASLSLAVMWAHWGRTVEDSLAYFNTARYLRGEIPISELRAPFPYRLLVPAIAAWLPGELHNTFATINWLSISLAATVLSWTVSKIGASTRQIVIAGLLLILSVPTFWYASFLLTDPGAIFARVVFIAGVLTGQPWLAIAAGLTATAVREENILLLVWLLAFRRVGWLIGLLALGSAIAWLLAVRWWLIPDLPRYLWVPSLATLKTAITDIRSMLSIGGAALLVVPLAAIGWRRSPSLLHPLRSLLALMALPLLYAALSVRVDGRAIWGLYPFLIPFAVYAASWRSVHLLEKRSM